jgi:hypothetical protein
MAKMIDHKTIVYLDKDKNEHKVILDPVLADSGTNIELISEETALKLAALGIIEMYVREDNGSLGYVMFGKEDAKAEIIAFVYCKGLLNRIAVVRGINVNLFSISWFTQERDMTVTFTKQFMDCKYNDILITRGFYIPDMQMYSFDIIELLWLPDPRKQIGVGASTLGEDYRAYASRKKERFSMQGVRIATEWHNDVGHIPYSIMGDNISTNAWPCRTGTSLAIIRELERRKACVTCALTRWTQITYEGSGIPLTTNPKDIAKY